MTDHTLLAIGMLIFGGIMATGISLSLWKGEFGESQYFCKNCCNPDHWSKEDRDKLTPEQYKQMKENLH